MSPPCFSNRTPRLRCMLLVMACLVHPSQELASVRRPKGKGLAKKSYIISEQLRLLAEYEANGTATYDRSTNEQSDDGRPNMNSKRRRALRRKGHTPRPRPSKKKAVQQSIYSDEIQDIVIQSSTSVDVTLHNGTTIAFQPQQLHQKYNEDVWLAIRARLDVTASEFSAVLDKSFFTSRQSLLETKLGLRPRFKGNTACTWGLNVEPIALRQYVEATQHPVNETGLHILGNYGASPDGIVYDPKIQQTGLLEIKSMYGKRNKQKLKQYDICPSRYYDQIQGQMQICDKPWCDLIMWIPKNSKEKNYSILRVARNQTYWDTILEPALQSFCEELETMKSQQQQQEKEEGAVAVAAELAGAQQSKV